MAGAIVMLVLVMAPVTVGVSAALLVMQIFAFPAERHLAYVVEAEPMTPMSKDTERNSMWDPRQLAYTHHWRRWPLLSAFGIARHSCPGRWQALTPRVGDLLSAAKGPVLLALSMMRTASAFLSGVSVKCVRHYSSISPNVSAGFRVPLTLRVAVRRHTGAPRPPRPWLVQADSDRTCL